MKKEYAAILSQSEYRRIMNSDKPPVGSDMSTTTLLRLPDLQGQSFDVYFRYDEFGADTHSPPHTTPGASSTMQPMA